MQYTIENEFLTLTVDSHGAEAVSLVWKADGSQLLWQADPAVWGRHAPQLFPYTGRIKGGAFTAKGQTYQAGAHGFARNMEHTLVHQEASCLTMELACCQETLALWPYEFVLRTTYRLEGTTLVHHTEVHNPGSETIQFGFGYHPAFVCPFDANHRAADYDIVFDRPQTPIVQDTPGGLCDGTHVLAENSAVLPMSDDMFAADSICLTQLSAKTLSVVERDSGRRVEVNIEGFPYVLLWSALTEQLKFVCVEPWHSLPDRIDATGRWEDKPFAAALKPGESWSTALKATFVR